MGSAPHRRREALISGSFFFFLAGVGVEGSRHFLLAFRFSLSLFFFPSFVGMDSIMSLLVPAIRRCSISWGVRFVFG